MWSFLAYAPSTIMLSVSENGNEKKQTYDCLYAYLFVCLLTVRYKLPRIVFSGQSSSYSKQNSIYTVTTRSDVGRRVRLQ
jgi:hypothetical protein